MAKDKDDAEKAAKKAAKKARKAEKKAQAAKEVLVSPLAPEHFPDLPVIKGVRFAAGSAGIKYQDRTDVTLISLPPGTAIAGAFTRSSTRARATPRRRRSASRASASLTTRTPRS